MEKLNLAEQYKEAWNQLFIKLDKKRRDSIIKEPHGKCANELAYFASLVAESQTGLDLIVDIKGRTD